MNRFPGWNGYPPVRDERWRMGKAGGSPFSARKDIRWGGTANIRWNLTALSALGTQGNSQQVLRASYPRPIAWQVQLIATSALAPAEAATFTIEIDTTFGTGATSATIPKQYTFAPPYLPIFDFGSLPAENIQVQAKVLGSPTVVGTAEGIDVSVYAAPVMHDYHDSEGYEHDKGFMDHVLSLLSGLAHR